MSEPGTVLGDFRLLRELGRGGMGRVFLAEQQSLGREVALKLLSPLAALDEVRMERFLREGEALAQLSHPAIVPVYGAGESQGTLYYAMEHVPGGTLAELLEAPEPPPLEQLVEMLATIAEALAHAHGHGFVHRDVKPANILVHEDGRVLLGDFGLVRHLEQERLSLSGAVMGTPHYMSPEQARGQREALDERSDVYSLGAVLYRSATGHLPFEGDGPQEILAAILTRTPQRPRARRASLHRDLETIVLEAMAYDPRDRYPSAADLAADLRAFLHHEPIRARRAGSTQRAWRWMRRRPLVAALGVILIAIAALTATLWTLDRRQARELERHAALERTRDAKECVQRAYRALQACTPMDRQGREQRAEELATRALEHIPDHRLALIVRALARSRSGIEADALRAALADLEAVDPPSRGTRTMQADLLERLGRSAEAEVMRQEAPELPRLDSSDYFFEASIHRRAGRPRAAVAVLDEGLERDPASIQLLHLRLAIRQHYLRAHAAAELDAHACMHLAWNEPWPRLHLIDIYRSSQQPERALAVARELVRMHPELGFARFELGQMLQAAGLADEALAQFQRALELDQEPEQRSWTKLQIGQIHEWRGALEEAFRFYLEATELGPRELAWRDLRVAQHYMGTGSYEEALPFLLEADELSPEDVRISSRLGYSLMQCDRHREAEGVLRRAVAQQPQEAVAWANLAQTLHILGKPLEAIGALLQLARLKPGNPEVRELLGEWLSEEAFWDALLRRIVWRFVRCTGR